MRATGGGLVSGQETRSPSVVEALAAAAAEVGAVAKTGRNERQRFLFRGVDAVVNAVAPALRHHHVLGPVPTLVSATHEEVGRSQSGARITRVDVVVTYTLYGPGGDRLEGTVAAEATDTADKATAKAMSVAMRTFLLQALCLPTDEPDPDTASVEASTQGEERAAQARDAVATVSKMECRRMVTAYATYFGCDPDGLVAQWTAEGGNADPQALREWLAARARQGTDAQSPAQAGDYHEEDQDDADGRQPGA